MLKGWYNLVLTTNLLCEVCLFLVWEWTDKLTEASQKKQYFAKNKQFCFWMSGDLFEWFIKYLNKYNYGNR
jgi:hypothetical protein